MPRAAWFLVLSGNNFPWSGNLSLKQYANGMFEFILLYKDCSISMHLYFFLQRTTYEYASMISVNGLAANDFNIDSKTAAAVLQIHGCLVSVLQCTVMSLVPVMTYCLSDATPMMTSSNGSIFRVTAHLCGEFTGPRWFPAQRPVTRSFVDFFDLRLNKRLSKQS